MIVAEGDSITDGTCSTLDGHDRWEDILALRLALQETGGWAVVNEGIAGNTVTRTNLTPVLPVHPVSSAWTGMPSLVPQLHECGSRPFGA